MIARMWSNSEWVWGCDEYSSRLTECGVAAKSFYKTGIVAKPGSKGQFIGDGVSFFNKENGEVCGVADGWETHVEATRVVIHHTRSRKGRG